MVIVTAITTSTLSGKEVIDMENHTYTTSNNSGIKPIDVAKAIGMSHEAFVKLPQGVQINWAKLIYQYGYCKPTR